MLFPPAKFTSADPNCNIGPPTPCPALAATLDFPQTDIPTWPVCSSPKPQGVEGTWDHNGEQRKPLDPWAAMGWDQEAESEQASYLTVREERGVCTW